MSQDCASRSAVITRVAVFAISSVLLIQVQLVIASVKHCKLNGQWMKAVTPHNGRLFLIISKGKGSIDDAVYSLPFSESHIDSVGRRFRLFDGVKKESNNWRIPEEDDPSWLKTLSNLAAKIKSNGKQIYLLMQLNVLPVSGSKNIYMDIKMSPPNHINEEEYSNHYLLKDKSLIEFDLGTLQEEYLLMSDGKEGGFVMWLAGKSLLNESTLSMEPVIREEGTGLIIPALPHHSTSSAVKINPNIVYYQLFTSADGSKVRFQKLESRPPPVIQQKHRHWKSQQFGFVFGGVVHYWDLYREKVWMFKVPPDNGKPVCLYEIKLSEYIACSEAEWSVKDKQQCDDSDTTKPGLFGRTMILIITTVTGVIFVGLIIALGIYCCCQARKRKSISGEYYQGIRRSFVRPPPLPRARANRRSPASQHSQRSHHSQRSQHSNHSHQIRGTRRTKVSRPKERFPSNRSREMPTDAKNITPTAFIFPTSNFKVAPTGATPKRSVTETTLSPTTSAIG